MSINTWMVKDVVIFLHTHTHARTHTQWNTCCLVAKLYLTLCDLMNGSLPGSSVHGISQATIPEWVAVSFSRENFSAQGSSLHLLHWKADSLPLYHWVTRKSTVEYCCCCSVAKSCLTSTPWTAAHQAPLSFNISRICSKSCELSQWWYLTISSSAALSSFCLQSSSLRVFSNESAIASGGQSIGVSASVSAFPMNIQDWFPLELTGLISLLSKGLSSVFSSTTVRKYLFIGSQPSLLFNSHIHKWLLEKP